MSVNKIEAGSLEAILRRQELNEQLAEKRQVNAGQAAAATHIGEASVRTGVKEVLEDQATRDVVQGNQSGAVAPVGNAMAYDAQMRRVAIPGAVGMIVNERR